MNHDASPARHIREVVFGFRTQAEFGAALGYEQATISRWESGVIEMSREAMDRIRGLATARGIAWDNNWFFGVPDGEDERETNGEAA